MKSFFSYVVFIVILFSAVLSYSQIPLGAALNISVIPTTGEFSKIYRGQYSIDGGIFYSFQKKKLDLTLNAGSGDFVYQSSYLINLLSSKYGVIISGFYPNWVAKNTSVYLGARYKLYNEGSTPYFSCEIGLNFLEYMDRFNGNPVKGNDSAFFIFRNINNSIVSSSESGPGLSFGAGLIIPIIPHLDADVGIKYNLSRVQSSKSFLIKRVNMPDIIIPGFNNLSFITLKAGIFVKM
jgi:hypothetical protein